MEMTSRLLSTWLLFRRFYDKIVVVVNIYQAVQRKQHFGMIKNAFIRIVDARNNTELCKYDLSEDYSNMTAMIFGEIYRHNGEWKFNAMGQERPIRVLVSLPTDLYKMKSTMNEEKMKNEI